MLDLNGPWFWILYTLAGAGITVFIYPHMLNAMGQLERDVFAAHPPVRALTALILWALWPLMVAYEIGYQIRWLPVTVYNASIDVREWIDKKRGIQ